MSDDEFMEMFHGMLNPPKPPPLTYKEKVERYNAMVEQLGRSAGNMGDDCSVIPEEWRGLENVGGGGEHCVIIPRPRKPE